MILEVEIPNDIKIRNIRVLAEYETRDGNQPYYHFKQLKAKIIEGEKIKII